MAATSEEEDGKEEAKHDVFAALQDLCGKQRPFTRACENPASPPHKCPYLDEIYGDAEPLCTCCDACMGECAGAI